LVLWTGALLRRLTVSHLLNPEGNTAMKTSILMSTFVACALSAPIVSAQDKSAPASPAMSMGMDKQMPQMQENMKKMQAQMEKSRVTTDPKERQALMQEHMQAMQDNMKAMRGMGGPMMMGGQKGGGMTSAGPTQRTQMMEQRMDMMQMMMEQMVQHDQMMQSTPAK
jgi:DNA-binding protein YbaB